MKLMQTLTAVATAGLMATLMTSAASAVTLNVMNCSEPGSIDPHQASGDWENRIIGDYIEGLMTEDANAEAIPGQAESYTVSEDGLVYTFTLRDGIQWSDGTPVTAGDFVFAFQRLFDPATASDYAYLQYPIKNGSEIADGSVTDFNELGVKALDDKTVEITLERPTPFFLELLAHQTALPVSKASVEKNGADFVKPGTMVSNGAFKLVSHVPDENLVVEKNAEYWDAANIKLDKVVFYPIDDQAASVRRFEAKEMDLVYNFSADQIERLKTSYGEQVRVSPTLATYYYAFDTRQEPYSDVNVRRALSMAVDRDFLAKEIYSGSQLPAYSMVPPGIEGYTPATADFGTMSQLDREDEAVKLMKAAGYGEGGKPLKIEIRYNTNPNHERVATAVADMWKNTFGADVSMVNLDVSSHYAYLQEGGKFNVARAGWVADYADAENFLALSVSTNKTFNYGQFNNADYDALMKKSYEERDPAARAKVLHDAEALLMKEQPIAPFLTQADLWLVSSKVQGWQDNAANQHLSRFLSVSE